MTGYILHDFPRASSAYRVRIGLAIKGIEYHVVKVDFRKDHQRSENYLEINPAGLVPSLQTPTGEVLTQSLAILGYLDQCPGPRLYPDRPLDRAYVDAMALTIACDIHPLNNLRVLNYLEQELGSGDSERDRWYCEWVTRGFSALDALVRYHGGQYCFGDELTVADICLVPQMYNARRFGVPLTAFEALTLRDRRLREHHAFATAHPDARI